LEALFASKEALSASESDFSATMDKKSETRNVR
jgi:hypothetical protein